MSTTKSTAACCLVFGLCCSGACATKFQAAPDAGLATNASPATGTAGVPGSPTGSAGSTGFAPNGTGGASVVGGGGGSVAVGGGTGGSGPGGASGTGSSPMGASGAGGTSAGGPGTGSAGQAAPQQCPTMVLAPGTTNGSVQVGGTMRNYILHVPASYTGKAPVPLVTDWHPILFNDSFEQGISGYQAKSDKEGFIVVWPDGLDNAWNIGDCCTTSRMVDDVGFAKALVAKLEQQACIDPKRVYAVGYSMGGGMSYKLACDVTDIFAAIAPGAFQLMQDSEWPCRPSRPITVISFNGTNDPVVPYAGGDVNPPNGLAVTNHFLGAVGTLKRWAQLDGCTDMPADKGGGCQTYSQCMGGVEVTLCTVQGGGHDPGDADVAWQTLKRFTLP